VTMSPRRPSSVELSDCPTRPTRSPANSPSFEVRQSTPSRSPAQREFEWSSSTLVSTCPERHRESRRRGRRRLPLQLGIAGGRLATRAWWPSSIRPADVWLHGSTCRGHPASPTLPLSTPDHGRHPVDDARAPSGVEVLVAPTRAVEAAAVVLAAASSVLPVLASLDQPVVSPMAAASRCAVEPGRPVERGGRLTSSAFGVGGCGGTRPRPLPS
jgi:hypothetical protein